MPRPSTIWKRSSDNCYYTTFKKVQYNLGDNLEIAKIRFRQLVGSKEIEPLITSICAAAAHIAKYMTKQEAHALMDSVYSMKESCND